MMVLGIDTSNYRTSLCVVDEKYEIVAEQNPLLPVREGEKGLRQSEAVFQHLKQWPLLLEKLNLKLSDRERISAIGVSCAPRPDKESYMPVFKVGEVLADSLAYFLSVPIVKTTHQEGHIAAGEYALGVQLSSPFLAIHISGGTSDILYCQRKRTGYHLQRIGGTLDLYAGQFVDRIGVALGLPFPSGPHLEQLAEKWSGESADQDFPLIPTFTKEATFSFSGPLTHTQRLIQSGAYHPGQIARAVEHALFSTLEQALRHVLGLYAIKQVLLVGGVAANKYLRQKLRQSLEDPTVGGQLFFAPPRYSTDNAYGVACIAWQYLRQRR